MRTIAAAVLVFSAFIIIAESCGKTKGGSVTAGGGLGGNATICVVPEHHGYLLDSCTISIKYGTLDAPADGIYDASQVCTMQGNPDTMPVACFPNLKNGIYYISAQGYHPGYGPVRGGESWTVSAQDTQLSYPIQNPANYLQTSTF